MVEAGIGEDGQGAHGGEDDEDPEEHAVHHHGHVLPVLLQLQEGWMDEREEERSRVDEEEGRNWKRKRGHTEGAGNDTEKTGQSLETKYLKDQMEQKQSFKKG